MTRLKLPPYGAQLRDQRRRGIHPLCVHLIYGWKWRAANACTWALTVSGAHPVLALKPDDYAPGVYDFAALTALQVCVFDQVCEVAWCESPDHGPARAHLSRFWWLLGELAACAADVEVYSPALSMKWSAFELARDQRRRAQQWNDGWPFWWSQSIEEKNAKRRSTWIHAALGLERESA